MDVIALFWHLNGFAAPAWGVGVPLGLVAWHWLGGRQAGWRWWAIPLACSLAGLGVLSTGLWWFGRDGKMATYAALCVVSAVVAWGMTLRRH
jgi:hypothetical protein